MMCAKLDSVLSGLFSLIMVLVLSSCGGGGGDNGNTGTPSTPSSSSSGGSVQLPFNRATGFSGRVNVVVPANDGSGDVYVGGQFNSYFDFPCKNFIRLNNDGSVDSDFIVGSGFSKGDNSSQVMSIALAQDGTGDVYVGGDFNNYNGTSTNNLARLNSNGTFDTGFNIGEGFSGTVRAIAVKGDADTRNDIIYVGGDFTTFNTATHNRIVRLDNNGAADATFVTGAGFDNRVTSILVMLKNGDTDPIADAVVNDVYIGGWFTGYNGTTGQNRIVRLNDDGSVDAGFSSATGFDAEVSAIIREPLGAKIYVAGRFGEYAGTSKPTLLRLNNNGSLDNVFLIGAGFGTGAQIHTVAAAGGGSNDIYVGGLFAAYDGFPRTGVIRLNDVGGVVFSFHFSHGFDTGADARVTNDVIYSVAAAVDGSGDVYIGGLFDRFNHIGVNSLIRLNQSGSRDAAFATGSRAGFNDRVTLLEVADDGDLYVAGDFTAHNGRDSSRIIRLNGDGGLDSGFVVGAGFNGVVGDIAFAENGDIYVGGNFTEFNGEARNRLVRLKPGGEIDTDFDIGSGFNAAINAIEVLASGDIYVAGSFTTYKGEPRSRIVRLRSDGTVNNDFSVDAAGFDGDVFDLEAVSNGDLYVSGAFTQYKTDARNRIVRLNSDGTLDAGFLMGAGFDAPVNDIVLIERDAGDWIYALGTFNNYDGGSASRLVRLLETGAMDVVGFDIGSGFGGPVTAMAVTHDGSDDIFVVGDFTNYRGEPHNRVVRLDSNGLVDTDTGFSAGIGFELSPRAVAVSRDGSGDVFIGGDFRTYQNTTVDRLVRLTASGSLN